MDIRTTIKLNSGGNIPALGLGVFQAPDGEECTNAVRWALEAGYRHIDTASIYKNEAGVGEGIRQSGVPREEIFLTTKLWNDDQRQGRQRQAFEESLERLGVDYVDLYLIHWPVAAKIIESWAVLEELHKEGRARAIGVSNFHKHHLDTLMASAKVTPSVNQIECHPRLTQVPLRAYDKKLDIINEAWSPLGGSKKGNLTGHPELSAIGAKYGKSAAQAMIRWGLQHGMVTIPKSVRKERILENAEVFDFALSAGDMAAIDAMNRDERVGPDPDNFDF
jgi:diketogulonate reductase-like aldo/keto reductase